jgi:uncharacterized protein (DUF885 family)
MKKFKCPIYLTILSSVFFFSQITPGFAQLTQGNQLNQLVQQITRVGTPNRSEAEYRAASKAYQNILNQLDKLEPKELNFEEQIDLDLAVAHVKRQLFEIDEIELYKLVPVNYYALGATNRLFVRPGAIGESGVWAAVRELERLPSVLENAKKNLTNPARTWTENAIYQAYYAKLLLRDSVPNAITFSAASKKELLAAAGPALKAVEDYEEWLKNDLLPRSTRSPAWKPEEVNFYQFEHEMLYDYGVDEMLRVAEEESKKTMADMKALAKRIHPSGDLKTVWQLMLEEAPPWEEVMPMAERFVEQTANWLAKEGSHLVTIPDFDYGVRITSPMSRRVLSFGGATYGPTVAGRLSGYYVLTPLEDILSEEEKASRIRSYNPYWTHVISYHEWLGHTVQRAAAGTRPQRPMRKIFRSIYHSQAWSFYLERLLEDEGYFEDVFDHMVALKSRMGRLQMRMWRIQRILTKLKMAKGEMTFDEAVQEYIDKIGMEPTNSFIEVQRDCQSPSPPGREIIGEMMIIKLREEYKKRMGEHYSMREFHDRFLSYGDLPFAVVRKLMLGE